MKTILIVEDNRDIRENTAEFLALAGYRVLTAEHGKAGVETAEMEFPDLVLCDIAMPKLDGFGVLFALNKNVRTAGIPFIFLTARAEMTDRRYGIGLGADDYIIKPYDPDYLLATVQAKLEKHEQTMRQHGQQLLGYIKELEDMLFMTSHKVRAPLCTCLGLVRLIEEDEDDFLTRQEFREILVHMKSSMGELDAFTRDLIRFLTEAKQNKVEKLGVLLARYNSVSNGQGPDKKGKHG